MNDVSADRAAAPQSILDRVFGLDKAGSNLRTEFIAELTTFLTMVYIVFVNPQILGNAGMDKGAVFVATCITAAASTLVMALYANYPIALAPRHGAQRVLRLHRRVDDEIYLAAGARRRVLFRRDLLSDLDLPHSRIHHQFDPEEPEARDIRRSRIVPRHHRAGRIQDRSSPATLVTLGDLRNPVAILCLLGLVLITALNYRRIIGGTLIGILIVTVIGIPLRLAT